MPRRNRSLDFSAVTARDGRTTYTGFGHPATRVGRWSSWARSAQFGGRDDRPVTFYAETVDGDPVSVYRTVSYEAVGSTTVERPTWYGRAVNGSVAEDGSRETPSPTPAVNESGSS